MDDLLQLKGVGDKTLLLLNKLNIYTINDLITYYPYRYDLLKRTNLNSERVIIEGIVETIPSVYRIKSNMNKMQFNVNALNKIIKVVIFNRGFMKNNLTIGKKIVLIGKYNDKSNTLTVSDILFNIDLTSPKIIPFYSTCDGLNKKNFHTIINNALSTHPLVIDYIPDYIKNMYSFLNKYDSLVNIHNPKDISILKKAMIRLKYEELFMFMLKINMLKSYNSEISKSYNKNVDVSLIDNVVKNLPYNLTPDQNTSLYEIINDLNSEVIDKKDKIEDVVDRGDAIKKTIDMKKKLIKNINLKKDNEN